MANLERMAVDWINSHGNGLPASMDVPERRPPEFVTVERTGGAEEPFRSTGTLAVQCWSTSRYKASELAEHVRRILLGMPVLPQVSACNVTGVYNYPEPDPPYRARYQLTVELTAKND